jgi:hypothetical protein
MFFDERYCILPLVLRSPAKQLSAKLLSAFSATLCFFYLMFWQIISRHPLYDVNLEAWLGAPSDFTRYLLDY